MKRTPRFVARYFTIYAASREKAAELLAPYGIPAMEIKRDGYIEGARVVSSSATIGALVTDERKAPAKEISAHASAAFNERDRVVAFASKIAEGWGCERDTLMFKCGIGRHPEEDKNWDPEWKYIIYIEIPGIGQVSWHIHDSELYLFSHLPPYTGKWDGHTTDEKYKRLEMFGKRP